MEGRLKKRAICQFDKSPPTRICLSAVNKKRVRNRANDENDEIVSCPEKYVGGGIEEES